MNDFNLFEQNSDLTIETIGTLNLKIERLEHRLQVLNQQQLLSQPYPDHKAHLAQVSCRTQFQLDRLKQCREKLLHRDSDGLNGRSSDGDFKNPGQTTFSFN